ncbi:MAG: PEP-CTERM system TPR-repeat protein PrsT [Pseudomonadales bacterium]|nr:PEP-CTERM system TPR-repeat protein PrsT [Pseudomonadales bacterium]
MKYCLIITLIIQFVIATAQVHAAPNTNEHYEKAISTFHAGKTSEAYIHLKNALQQDPKHIPSKLLIAQVMFGNGDVVAAGEELEQALELGADINLVLPLLGTSLILQKKIPEILQFEKRQHEFNKNTRFEWKLLLGQIQLLEQEPELARNEFESALAMYPENQRALNTLATVYMRFKDYIRAQELIDKSLLLFPDAEKTWHLNGELALKQKQLKQAINYFQKAYAIDKDDPNVLRSLASTYLKTGDLENAKTYMDAILEQTPNDPTAILINAAMLLSTDNKELAMESLAKLSDTLSVIDLQLLEDDAHILFVQAASAFMQGADAKARQMLELYLSKRAQDIRAVRMLAELYLKRGEQNKAIALLESRKPYIARDLSLSARLIQLYFKENKLLDAEEIITQAKQNFPDHIYLAILEARLMQARGRYSEALVFLDKYVEDSGRQLKDAPIEFLLLKGELEIVQRRFKAALTTAKIIEQRSEMSIDAYNFIAIAYWRNGLNEAAIKHLQNILKEDSGNLVAQFHLASIYSQTGQIEAARKLLQAILKTTPKHIPSLFALAKLDFNEGNLAGAGNWLEKLLVVDPGNRQANEMTLAIAKSGQNWSEALIIAERLHKSNTLNPVYLVEKIKILSALNRFDDTPAPANILYSIWSDSAKDLIFLTDLMIQARQYDFAEKAMEKALYLEPDSTRVLLAYANLAFEQGKVSDAASRLSALNSKAQNLPEFHVLNGKVAERGEHKELALKHYGEALDIDGQYSQAWIGLYELAKTDTATNAFLSRLEKEVQKINSPDWMKRMLADAYVNSQQLDKAAPFYEKLLQHERFENDIAMTNNLANIYARTDIDKALALALKTLEQSDRPYTLLDTVGWLNVRKGNLEEGLAYLREAYAKNASNGEVRYHIGVALSKLGRSNEAISELKAALSAEENERYRDEAEKLLAALKK